MSPLHAFAFGKLPTHGDFVARGLPADERQAWDAWSSAGLETAMDALGEDFPLRHDVAQPWRFAFGPGAFGPGSRAGVIAPSIDAAGRRFVIVLGARASEDLTAPDLGDRIAEAAENELYRAFESVANIDDMIAGAQTRFSELKADGVAQPGGRFWSIDPPCEITALQPPADLLVRVLTT